MSPIEELGARLNDAEGALKSILRTFDHINVCLNDLSECAKKLHERVRELEQGKEGARNE